MELQQQEYLTFSKAAILLGCTRQYVYKLIEQGKLPASRLSSRMALVRRGDIEKMFAANPYNRVLPGSYPKTAIDKKAKASSKKDVKSEKEAQASDEIRPLLRDSSEVSTLFQIAPSHRFPSKLAYP